MKGNYKVSHFVRFFLEKLQQIAGSLSQQDFAAVSQVFAKHKPKSTHPKLKHKQQEPSTQDFSGQYQNNFSQAKPSNNYRAQQHYKLPQCSCNQSIRKNQKFLLDYFQQKIDQFAGQIQKIRMVSEQLLHNQKISIRENLNDCILGPIATFVQAVSFESRQKEDALQAISNLRYYIENYHLKLRENQSEIHHLYHLFDYAIVKAEFNASQSVRELNKFKAVLDWNAQKLQNCQQGNKVCLVLSSIKRKRKYSASEKCRKNSQHSRQEVNCDQNEKIPENQSDLSEEMKQNNSVSSR